MVFMNTKHTPLWRSTVRTLCSPYSHPYVEALFIPLWKQLTDRLTAARRALEVLKLAWRLTPSLLEQRKLRRYTTRDDCAMQHGHELCNHLQERKLKCKNSALCLTLVSFSNLSIICSKAVFPCCWTELFQGNTRFNFKCSSILNCYT